MTPRTIDFLDMFCGTLEGNNLSGRYIVRALPRVFCVKNYNGYPIDTLYVDTDSTGKEIVTDNFTEGDPNANAMLSGWGNPNSFKFHTGRGGRGNIMMLRRIPYPLTSPLVVTDETTPFSIFTPVDPTDRAFKSGTKLLSQIHHVGMQKRILNPPTLMDWGKDVGKVLTWNYQYFYNGRSNGGVPKYNSLEEYKLAFDPDDAKKEFGLVLWDLYKPGTQYKTPNDGSWDKVSESHVSNVIGGFHGKTPDGRHDQDARLVVFPFLGLDGVVAK
jgi:hypothetical protein